ncbi:protein BUD31 homolog isoform X1 [Peromyscus eremicus]|uniref:protein BUD31 homolog isoform X1 n=1 Tax=Peromyscus eremicus TaxID=42410 RepID=UPI0027DE8FB0|nr:protein BUD31 homolog isoform X1 [Peromyscus eremicus]
MPWARLLPPGPVLLRARRRCRPPPPPPPLRGTGTSPRPGCLASCLNPWPDRVLPGNRTPRYPGPGRRVAVPATPTGSERETAVGFPEFYKGSAQAPKVTQSPREVGGAPRGPYPEEFLTRAEAVNKEAAAVGACSSDETEVQRRKVIAPKPQNNW